MGCSESKDEIQLQELFAKQLKNSSVVAAMESLEIDFRDTGLRFYRVFAKMDTDASHSIDLDEFHVFFKLPRTRLSDQVFSALGHQSADRAVTFDDFMLNMWNFGTMSGDDLTNHVFCVYDDDHSGTLDSAECDSLFRLLYNTSELPSEIKQLIADVDANGDGLLDKDEFAMICKKNRNLLKPIFLLQSSAQEKCLGKAYWKAQQKKRSRILAGQKDVFQLATQRLARENETQQKVDATSRLAKSPNEPRPSDSQPPQRRASERVSARQVQQDLDELETWITTQEVAQPLVDRYFKTHCDKLVTATHLTITNNKATSQPSQDTIQLLTDLRHHLAICEKRFEEAKAKLKSAWGEEEIAERSLRHATVRTTVGAVSAQTLLKHSGKQNAASAMGSYLQKKLDAATDEVRAQFQQRWDTLEKAASLLGDRALAAAPPPAERMREKKSADKPLPVQRIKSFTRVLPVVTVEETWTQFFDATQNLPYYVSSLGNSTWERPANFISQ